MVPHAVPAFSSGLIWAKCGCCNSASFAASRRCFIFLVIDVGLSSSSNNGLWKLVDRSTEISNITLLSIKISYYLHKGGYVFVVVCFSVCLFVCLLVTLQKNFPADLNETFRKCWQWADEQVVKFWWQSWSPSGYGDCFPDSSLLGDTESVINRLRCATLHCRASTSRYRHSNYDVITCWSVCSKAPIAAKLIICCCFFRVCCSPAMANSIKAHAEKPLLLFWLTMSGCQSKLFFSICRQLAWSGWPGTIDRRQLRSVATINQKRSAISISAWESKHALSRAAWRNRRPIIYYTRYQIISITKDARNVRNQAQWPRVHVVSKLIPCYGG